MSKQVKRTEVQKLQSKVRKLQKELRDSHQAEATYMTALNPALDLWHARQGPASGVDVPTVIELVEWLLGLIPGEDPRVTQSKIEAAKEYDDGPPELEDATPEEIIPTD